MSLERSTGDLEPHGAHRGTNVTSVEPHPSLAAVLRRHLQQQHMSIYQLSQTSGVDGAYIWRIVRGERQNVSREILIRLGTALVLELAKAEQVIDTTNELLDAAGFKQLS